MNPLSSQWRDEAKQLRTAANSLLAEENAETLAKDVRLQISAVVGKVMARTLEIHADTLDYMTKSGAIDEKMKQRQAFMEKNDAIRRAAANAARTGDWSEFDKLAGDAVDPTGNADGGAGPAGGSA